MVEKSARDDEWKKPWPIKPAYIHSLDAAPKQARQVFGASGGGKVKVKVAVGQKRRSLFAAGRTDAADTGETSGIRITIDPSQVAENLRVKV